MQDDSGFLILLAMFGIVAAIIFAAPSFIAFRRQHPNRWAILLINAVFGGTILGWGVALVWALKAIHRPGTANGGGGGGGGGGGESGLNIFVNDVKKVQVVEPPPLPHVSASEEIARLHSLLTQGAISQTEYDGLKAKVVGS